MILKTLPIDKSNIKLRPNVFIIDINKTSYKFEFSYNIHDENIYISMYESPSDNAIFEGRKLVYGQDIMEYEPVDFAIIAYDFSGQNNRITYENLIEEVRLYIATGDIDA